RHAVVFPRGDVRVVRCPRRPGRRLRTGRRRTPRLQPRGPVRPVHFRQGRRLHRHHPHLRPSLHLPPLHRAPPLPRHRLPPRRPRPRRLLLRRRGGRGG